jgi:aminoglycoside phosphotransferase (APT) family kinase protein
VAEEEIRTLLQSDWPHAVNPPVLLHGDYWPGNVLWRDNKLAAVIDWEDAALGDPLSELANARLELRWILGAEATQAFTAHYQAALPVHAVTDYSNLPYWDLCAALHLIHHAADWDTWAEPLPSDGRDVTASTIARDLADFVEQARAQIRASRP